MSFLNEKWLKRLSGLFNTGHIATLLDENTNVDDGAEFISDNFHAPSHINIYFGTGTSTVWDCFVIVDDDREVECDVERVGEVTGISNNYKAVPKEIIPVGTHKIKIVSTSGSPNILARISVYKDDSMIIFNQRENIADRILEAVDELETSVFKTSRTETFIGEEVENVDPDYVGLRAILGYKIIDRYFYDDVYLRRNVIETILMDNHGKVFFKRLLGHGYLLDEDFKLLHEDIFDFGFNKDGEEYLVLKDGVIEKYSHTHNLLQSISVTDSSNLDITDNGNIIANEGNAIKRFHSTTGSVVWTNDEVDYPVSVVRTHREFIYVGIGDNSDNNYVVKYDINGNILWKFELNRRPYAIHIRYDRDGKEIIYVGSHDRDVTKFSPDKDGASIDGSTKILSDSVMWNRNVGHYSRTLSFRNGKVYSGGEPARSGLPAIINDDDGVIIRRIELESELLAGAVSVSPFEDVMVFGLDSDLVPGDRSKLTQGYASVYKVHLEKQVKGFLNHG